MYMVYHSREFFNINLPTAHYGTAMLTEAQKSKTVMRMPVENQTKPNQTINYGEKAALTHLRMNHMT